MPFLRKELSEMIGVSADHIGREIRKLASEGVVKLSGTNHEVVILDEKALNEIIHQYK
jgi:DNA-binding Lrp family transcriptional regulator